MYTNNTYKTKAHTFSDVEDIAAILDKIGKIASLSDVGATDITAHLELISANLRIGKVRSAIVGLTKAGKTTTLNALLGQTFLPSTIQPQTAKEVKIIHSPTTPEGSLYVVKEKGSKPVSVASKKDEINNFLVQVNSEEREGQSSYNEIILHAPFIFLSESSQVKLELSDTPGLFEATDTNITSDSEHALKEMCAFVLILNLELLKTELESRLLQAIVKLHPDLLTKRTRVLILVNALDTVYSDKNLGSLKPTEIENYVSEYLEEPTILGFKIPPSHIIPFSAKWALIPRIWLANPSAFVESEGAQELYEEALILLRRAGYKNDVDSLEAMNEENVRFVGSLLIKFSQIETIEAKLKEMLYINGPDILLEATVDDTIVAIQNLEEVIEGKIKEQNLETKQKLVELHNNLLASLTKTKEAWFHSAKQIPNTIINSVKSQVNTMTDSLKSAINSKIGNIVMKHLNGLSKENRQEVFTTICSLKNSFRDPAQSEQANSWSSISKIVRSSQLEHLKSVLARAKTEVANTFQIDVATSTQFPLLKQLSKDISSNVLTSLDKLDPNSLLHALPSLNLAVNPGSIPNDRLNHITQTKVTKYRTEYRSKKKKSGFLGLKRKKKTWSVSVPYQVPVFSPNIPAIKNAISEIGVSQWAQSFRKKVDEVVAQTSQQLVQEVTNVMTKILSQAENSLQQACNEKRDEEQKSRAIVDQLQHSKKEIIEAKAKMVALQN